MASLKFGMVGRCRMAAVDVMEMAKTIAERDRVSLEVAKKVVGHKLLNQHLAERAAKRGLVAVGDESGAKKRAINTARLLRFLRDHDLIQCKKAPHLSTASTRTTIQHLTYIATRIFGLRPGHWYVGYIYGPYSMELAGDYYFVKDIGDHEPISLSVWPARDKFLEFVQDHDTSWLEAVATLYFEYEDQGLNGVSLVEYVEKSSPRLDVKSAFADLQNAGFMGWGDSNA